MKIICNSLYQHLIDPKYYEEVSFLDNDACEHQGEGYDLSEVEMAVMQPFYFNKEFLDKMIKILAYQSKKKANRAYKKKIKKMCESL